MTDNQENKYTMYESTLAVMTANNAIWNAITPIGDTITKIQQQMDLTPTGASLKLSLAGRDLCLACCSSY